MSTSAKISVVLVDDSSVIRGVISRILQTDRNIEVVGTAANGELAIKMALEKKPNIMILDVEMPVMDGLDALPHIMKASPLTKVIMCSSLTAKGADITMKAFTRGAVECLVKPSSSQDTGPGSPFQVKLLNLVKTLGRPQQVLQPLTPIKPSPQPAVQTPPTRPSGAPLTQTQPAQTPLQTQKISPTVAPPVAAQPTAALRPITKTPTINNDPTIYKGKPDILAIGSSTGGPQALFQVLSDLGSVNIPIVITQHMPATFTKILADHITQKTSLTAHEGEDGMLVENGKVYVAPGGKHMLFEKRGTALHIKLNDGPDENFCKPAVDPMLRSLIDIYGKKILCTILTGMGHDGLLGARALSSIGGRIIAQDEQTSVVWGMPGAVAMDGICSEILPLNTIGGWLQKALA